MTPQPNILELRRLIERLTHLVDTHRLQIAEHARHNALLREAEAARTAELAGLIHELKKPLTIIQSLRAQPTTLSAHTIDTELARAGHMLDRIISLAHLQQVNPHTYDLIDLSRLVRNVGAYYAQMHPTHVWHTVVAPEQTIPGNQELIYTLLENALDNAVKHTPAESSIDLTLGVDETGAPLLTLRDTGPGLPEELQTHVGAFRRGWQGTAGAGLGLSSMLRAAKYLHAELTFVSAPEGGLIVQVLFSRP